MVADAMRSLLERRLVIVTGKGGTGKTTVAATLALAAARSGLKVLVAEVSPDEHLPRLISPGGPPVGYEGRTLLPGLRAMRIDPFEALAEYLALQVGIRAIVDVLMRNKGFSQLLNAAPGWRELITLGKVWHLEQFEEEGIPIYDLIVVDAPATGHGVTFLDVPRVVVSAVRTGPLRRHAGLVEAMIRDRRRTLLLPVSLAEELPVRETAELVASARDDVGIAIDRVVVNGVLAAPFPAGLEELDQLLEQLPGDAPIGDFASPSELAFCATYLGSRHRLNQAYTKEVAASTGLPTLTLPYLPLGVRGPDDLQTLASALLAEPTEGSSR